MKSDKIKLTVQVVKTAAPRPERYTLWDSEVKGLGLRVNVDGSKTYVLKYYQNGRQGWVTIGKHGAPFTPDTARIEAQKLLGQSRTGTDPVEARRAERTSALTVAQLCDDYWIEVTAGRIMTRADQPKKASTLVADRGRIDRHIKPLIGAKRVKDLRTADIERFLHDVAAGKTAADIKTGTRGRAIVEGGAGTATRTVGLLGGILSYAVKVGIRADNPARGVRRFKDKRNERFLPGNELQTLGRVLAEAEQAWAAHEAACRAWTESGRVGRPPIKPTEAENPIAVAALRLLLLTGARKMEVLGLRWEWVDLQTGYLRLPDSKTGAKLIPLAAPALQLLAGLPRLEQNPHVFPGDKRGAHLVGLPKIWERIRARAGLGNVRIHDLRHSFASVAAAGGDSLLLIGALLGHKDAKTTQRYAHLGQDPVKAAADRVGKRIAAVLDQGQGPKIKAAN